jgi:glycosyltransferase involved in cell wall biosynthesis
MPTKMRIVLINTNKNWGGGEVWFFNAALALRNRGYSIVTVTHYNSPLEMRFRDKKVPFLSVQRPPIYALFLYLKIKKFFDINRPDMVIVNAGVDLIYAEIIKHLIGNFKLIFRRGLDKPLKNSVLNRKLYQSVDYFLVNSRATANTLQTSFPWLKHDKVHILYNPVNLNLHSQTESIKSIDFKIPGQETIILGIIARLTEQKGHTILFEAVKRIIPSHNNLLLLIIGQGELEQSLKNEVRALKIESYCRFLGHQDTISPYYQLCDLIIIPSLFEGFCYVAVEAQYHQKAVIASDTSSLKEVVQDGKTGLLFEPGNSADLAEKIISLLNAPDIRKLMGKKGKEFVENNFASELIYNKLENLLTEWK